MSKIYKYKMHYMVMRNSAVLVCKLVYKSDRFEEVQKIVIYQSKMYSP